MPDLAARLRTTFGEFRRRRTFLIRAVMSQLGRDFLENGDHHCTSVARGSRLVGGDRPAATHPV